LYERAGGSTHESIRAGISLDAVDVAREPLSSVAYRQPITRADVESIRGVGSSDLLTQLMDKGMIRIAGRDNSLGRQGET
jgi:segregation and condensation protein B